ncbi:MAG: aldose 1-epimerase family protein [Chthonomonadales bacterium]|nr:aldose 1-epimerase family protein [Chthonomonadales bacterium]
MARLYGSEVTRAEIARHVGDMAQIARTKPYRLAEGFEAGTLAVDVSTGTGFQFTVVPDRALDVSSASLGGRSLAWRSAQTDRHPAYYEPAGLGWLRSFPGGLLATCGLLWHGAPTTDEGERLGLHGRVSNTPATNVHWDAGWDGDDYVLSVSGRIREAVVFGANVELRRRVWTRMGESRLFIDDTVENLGFEAAPHMLLYHVNVGFPAVAPDARIVAPSTEARPRDADAAEGGERWDRLDAPTAGYREKCYFHTMRAGRDGAVTAAVINPALDGGVGFGVYVRYRPEQLPFFTQWKMMGEGAYVVGLEPCNALVMGRDVERREGRLQHLEPGERRSYRVEIGAAAGAEALASLEAAAGGGR